MPQGTGKYDIRVARIDDHATDAAGLFQAHKLPGLAGVTRLVNPPPDRDVASDPSLAGAGPNYIRIRGRNGKRSDGSDRLIVKDGLPVDPSVSGLEDSARSGPGIVDVRLPGDPGDRADSVADR